MATPNVERRTSNLHTTGIVWLVGAGPGDPDLITVAGLNALRCANVVVYDRLAAPVLLREARADALLIDAGKAPGAHTLGQDGINAVLADHALAGRTVVRLKGGDPFLFGRGGEEALYLHERGIPFRVVPGVTSAVAAPAFAGIPVTHRGIAGSVLIATGHESAESASESMDWPALARAANTLIFLMGVERLEGITSRLIDAGRPADQPAALVRWGSTPEQQVVSATLGTIVDEARAKGIRPPAALVVGEVVRLREHLTWFEALPLFGARVLVTRTREQASGLVARLRELGAVPLEFPAIATEPLTEMPLLDKALRSLPDHGWVVFTSQNGVSTVLDRLDALDLDLRIFAGVRIVAVGPATARALRSRGLRADLVPETYSGAGVVQAMAAMDVSRARVILVQPDIAPPDLEDGLRSAGAEVTRVAAYQTVAGPGRRAELDRLLADGVDAVTFTSSSTVTNLMKALGGDQSPVKGAIIASIGPMTSAAVAAAGLPVDVEADQHTIDGLVDALCAAWRTRAQEKESVR